MISSLPCGMEWSAPADSKFFERPSDEMLRGMQLRSEPAMKNQQKHARFACSGACSCLLCFCSRPCYPPARFSRNADFIGVSKRSDIRFPVLYRAEANKIGACKLRLCFCKLDGCEGHPPKSARHIKNRALTSAYVGCRLTYVHPVSLIFIHEFYV